MGLMVHSIARLPPNYHRAYYLYLLDYGWDEPLGDALFANFDQMATIASRAKAIVIRGTVGSHFEDEVLSWHHFNGQPSDDLLPAIMITTKHPSYFQHYATRPTQTSSGLWSNEVVLLIPLRRCCANATDVTSLIEKIFTDIIAKKPLADFRIAKEMHTGKMGAVLDALILEPNVGGVGVDLKKLANIFTKPKGST